MNEIVSIKYFNQTSYAVVLSSVISDYVVCCLFLAMVGALGMALVQTEATIGCIAMKLC